jgi:response regulator RpfG family c-di-GMP phosphodiesterase
MAIKVGQYFIEKGLVTEKDVASALEYQKKRPGYLGEILLSQELITETDLLHYLSKRFNVQYISSEKLEKIPAQHPVDVIPEKLALEKNIYPLKYSFNNFRLTLLTHEPQNIELLDELKVLLTGVNTIVPVVASSNAVKALIYKQYRGDLSSFERLVKKGVDMNILMPGNESVIGHDSTGNMSQTIQGIITEDSRNRNENNATFSAILNQGEIVEASSVTASMVSLMPGLAKDQQGQFIEIIRVFANLMDTLRDDSFFGHTQRVVNLSSELGQEISLSDVELHDLLVAAYLHDVGKKNHLTALDIKQKINNEKLIKYAGIASKLFANVDFSKLTLSYLANMYETYNGAGVPKGLSLNEVPNGSMILLLSDTYDFMTRVSKIPAATAYKQIKDLLFFPDKLMLALKKIEQIDAMPQSSETPVLEGVIISRKRFDCDDISDRLNRLNVKTYKADMVEKAAQIIKDKRSALNFILCDLDMPESTITPIKFLAALKHKKEFSEIPFYFFSQFSIDRNIITAAKALKISGIFPNYHPIEMTRKIVDDIKNIKRM